MVPFTSELHIYSGVFLIKPVRKPTLFRPKVSKGDILARFRLPQRPRLPVFPSSRLPPRISVLRLYLGVFTRSLSNLSSVLFRAARDHRVILLEERRQLWEVFLEEDRLPRRLRPL